MTRALARQLNIEVKSLLFESRLDISESWILPHAPYVCLISFAGEDGKRIDDRETKEGLLFSDQTGLTAGQTGQTDAPAESLTGGPTALHAGRTGATAGP